jgi:hypothetical protein
MRLLYFAHGELSLTEDMFNDGSIPPYAILSHTWGNEEVVFDEIVNNKGRNKAGYGKILFCAQQAAADGLQYCWVDSCCINKSNSAELTEAINSMFRWYQNAERCYVLLTDVLKNDQDLPDASGGHPDEMAKRTRHWKTALRKSRWFTRGWTLQELIAPSNVEFFAKNKEYLGDKQSLEEEIHDITGIPTSVLRHHTLRDFSIEERFSWTASRQTTYEEDMAYCLLGIFDINMPLLYGEGKMNAMKRLRRMAEHARDGPSGAVLQQKLSGLRQWLGVPDPSTIPQRGIKVRLQNTRPWVLESVAYTIWKTKPASFLWFCGRPGSGKTVASTAILEDLLHRCDRNLGGVCAHYYFNFRNAPKEDSGSMLRSLIYQLTKYCVRMPGSLETLFALRDGGSSQPPLSVLVQVLRKVVLEFPQVFILIEGLDECAQLSEALRVLRTLLGWQLQNLHLLIVSRREVAIELACADYLDKENRVFLGQEEVE